MAAKKGKRNAVWVVEKRRRPAGVMTQFYGECVAAYWTEEQAEEAARGYDDARVVRYVEAG